MMLLLYVFIKYNIPERHFSYLKATLYLYDDDILLRNSPRLCRTLTSG